MNNPEGKIEGFSLKPAWQICPKCNGQGIVSNPPNLPAEIESWSNTTPYYECNVTPLTKHLKKSLYWFSKNFNNGAIVKHEFSTEGI